MRRMLFVAFWLAAVAITALAEETFSCVADLSAHWKTTWVPVSLPLGGILGRIIEKVEKEKISDVVPGVRITWTLEDTLVATMHCGCPKDPRGELRCCSGPNARAFARLTLYQVLAAPYRSYGTVYPVGGNALTNPISSGTAFNPETGFGGKDLCDWPGAVELTIHNYTGRVGITVGLEWLFTVDTVEVSIDANQICDCNPMERCIEEATNAPSLVIPNQIVVPEGGTREFIVWVNDLDKDVVSISIDKGKIKDYVTDAENRVIGAKILVLDQSEKIWVRATDACGHASAVSREVIVVHPPKIEKVGGRWSTKSYLIWGWVWDPDAYRATVERELAEEVTVGCGFVSTGGGKFLIGPYPHALAQQVQVEATYFACDNEGCRWPFAAEFTFPNRGAPRQVRLFIYARDKWGFEDHWTETITNQPPKTWMPQTWPPSSSPVRVRRGEEAKALVVAEDPEGLEVTLTKLRGPGEFPELQGEGRVVGVWSWRANTTQPWHLIAFFSQDPPFEGGTLAYLLLHVLQPPRTYRGYARVRRGETATAYLYLDDPDSSSHTFSFLPPPGLTVSVAGKEDTPEHYGEYHSHLYRVEIRVDRSLCDGVYSVPFTVTDSDGLSAEGTLVVHVFGNRPPEVRGKLYGEATVVLYPDRAEVSPVVVRGEVFDPEGDQVFVEAPGIPPQFAANLSAFLGSLVSVYFPYPESEGVCRAVREEDVIEDFYTVILRDSCGAITEVPVAVRIKVEDRIPPKIVYPAQNKTVECNDSGNTEELLEWLKDHGGAWAFDNCCDVVWTHDYSPEKFMTTCGKAGYVRVTFTAHDCAGNSSSTSATFHIVDTTPPSLQAPPDVTIERDEPADPLRTGWPTVFDVCDPNPAITYTDEVLSGACLQAKVIRRTWRAVDACGNPSQAVQIITVVDTKAPEFVSFPSDLDMGCNPSDTSPNATGMPVIRDNCDPNPQLTYSDSVSQEGCRVEILRTWRAQDACGNVNEAVQRIVYTADTVPPVLSVPPNVDLGCHCSRPDTSPDVTGWAQATDNCDPQPTIAYSDVEDIQGEFHTITRTWVAVDSCGNKAQGTQIIWFRIDQTPPTLSVPADRDLGCHCTPPDTSPGATGWAQATDNCDPNPVITYEDTETVEGRSTPSRGPGGPRTAAGTPQKGSSGSSTGSIKLRPP